MIFVPVFGLMAVFAAVYFGLGHLAGGNQRGPRRLAYLYYERTKPVVTIDVPGVAGEITKEGVDIEVGKPKN